MSGAEEAREAAAPRERLTAAQRRRAAQRLIAARGRDRHLASRLADALDVSAHWLRALRRRLERGEEPSPRRGRPRLAEEERARVRALVEAELAAQGDVGWRRVLAGIRRKEADRERPTSTMLVQEETAAAKERSRAARGRALESAREGHEALARDAVWAQDATHLGRVPDGRKIEAELATDRATTQTVIASAGLPATGAELVALLERARGERGGLPFVWQSDRGGANRSAVLARYLAAERVIHLLSRPHTPTDNPAAESKNREIKDEASLGKGTRLLDALDAAERLAPALERVDAGRLRATRGYRTAEELDRELPRADAVARREDFYEDARAAAAAAVLGLSDLKQRRRAQQDAIWRTLEKHGLARSRVGLKRVPCPRLTPVAAQATAVECPRGHRA